MKIRFLIAAAAATLSFGVASAQAAPGSTKLSISKLPHGVATAKVQNNRVRKEQVRQAQKLLEQYKQAVQD